MKTETDLKFFNKEQELKGNYSYKINIYIDQKKEFNTLKQ